jgi:hypothetical protein
MTAYLTLLALILMPYLLGVHVLVVMLLFIFRAERDSETFGTLLRFTAAALPLSALYVWAAFSQFSTVALALVGALALYTGVVAAMWRILLKRWAARKDKTLNK